MQQLHINIIEHHTIPENEARVISDKNASLMPRDLRDKVSVPCILINNLELSPSKLTLIVAQALSEHLDTHACR